MSVTTFLACAAVKSVPRSMVPGCCHRRLGREFEVDPLALPRAGELGASTLDNFSTSRLPPTVHSAAAANFHTMVTNHMAVLRAFVRCEPTLIFDHFSFILHNTAFLNCESVLH